MTRYTEGNSNAGAGSPTDRSGAPPGERFIGVEMMKFPTHLWFRLHSFGFVVCAGLVALGVALMFLPLLKQRRDLQRQADQLGRELVRQETVEREQLAEIELLRNDRAYVEKIAREKLNLARPNETLFRFEPRPEIRLPRR